jgi:threonine/homoserine/homoserine lactone efflux protein
MSKAKKEMRAAKKAAREEREAKRVINWIVGALIILFAIAAVYGLLIV